MAEEEKGTAPAETVGAPSENFQLDIRAHGFDLTPALRQYATEHVVAKLAKHGERIQAVVIRLDDANGTKGGEDMVCRVEVIVPGEPPLVVEEVRSDMRAAMDLASDRMEKVLSRKLERRSDKPRHDGRKIVHSHKLA
jgi:ribosomal subunit interface protein